jgi:uncharacterized protein YcbK (DUF882 family)
MSDYAIARLSAAFCLALSAAPAVAQPESNPLGFISTNPVPGSAPAGAPATAPAAADKPAKARRDTSGVVSGNVHRLQRANAGSITRQTPSVATGCLRGDLMGILRKASNDFGSEVVITSGFRGGRGRSYHAKCMAADVQIAGVGPGALAGYFRRQGGVGGVGTYGHTRSVHVDVAPRTYSWHGRSRRLRVADACPCCGGAAHGAKSAIACERSVIKPDLKLGNARG